MSARIRGDGCCRNVEARVGPVRDDARGYFLEKYGEGKNTDQELKTVDRYHLQTQQHSDHARGDKNELAFQDDTIDDAISIFGDPLRPYQTDDHDFNYETSNGPLNYKTVDPNKGVTTIYNLKPLEFKPWKGNSSQEYHAAHGQYVDVGFCEFRDDGSFHL